MDNLKEATLQSELRFKDLIINPCHRSVLINNNRIDLTTKEFDLLYFLAIHPGWAFTKSQIYETVWGEEYVCNQHAVENIIYNLRRKMAINSTSINYIQTLVIDRNSHFRIFAVLRQNSVFAPELRLFSSPNNRSNQHFSATPITVSLFQVDFRCQAFFWRFIQTIRL